MQLKIFPFFIIIWICLLGKADYMLAGDCDDPGYPDQYPYSCEEMTSIIFNIEGSVEELDSNSSGTVEITGGSGNYTWSISGAGFSLSESTIQTRLKTTAQSITVYTESTACGACKVMVTDGCSTSTYHIRATSGTWNGPYTGCKAPLPLIEEGNGDQIIGNIRQLSSLGNYLGNINCGLGFTGAGCAQEAVPAFCNSDCLASKPCGNAEDWLVSGSLDCLSDGCPDGLNCMVQWGESDNNLLKNCQRRDTYVDNRVWCVETGYVWCRGWNNIYYEWTCQ